MFRTFLSMILAASFASVFPQSCSAEIPQRKTVSVSVYYGDLNLRTDAGAQTLLKRLKTAGRQACGGRPPAGSVRFSSLHSACMREAVSSAVEKLRAPAVTAQLMAQNTKAMASR
jgi:UrcA family protein